MNLASVLGMLSAFSLLFPVILIIVFKLLKLRSFLALAIYYFISSIYILGKQGVIPIPNNINFQIGFITNLLDAPLMLIFLCWFSFTPAMAKRIRYGIYSFILFEVATLAIVGNNIEGIKTVLGPGIVLVLILTSVFFTRQIKLTVMQQKGMGKCLMICSVLFAYTLYLLIYLFYYLLDTPYKRDALIVYYIVSLIASILMSIGIRFEVTRIRKINELKHTRKELAEIYGNRSEKIVFKPIS